MNLKQTLEFYKKLNNPRLSEKIFNQIFETQAQPKNQYELVYINSEIKIKEFDSEKPILNLGVINIGDTQFFTQLEIENQINMIINKFISSNIISKYNLQKQLCELYNQEILNHIAPPDSEELKFNMINSFYEKMDLLMTFSTIENCPYLKEI
mgnify:CR=1 FL=1